MRTPRSRLDGHVQRQERTQGPETRSLRRHGQSSRSATQHRVVCKVCSEYSFPPHPFTQFHSLVDTTFPSGPFSYGRYSCDRVFNFSAGSLGGTSWIFIRNLEGFVTHWDLGFRFGCLVSAFRPGAESFRDGTVGPCIAVVKISDWFDPPAWGVPERRFNGSALSEVRESPRPVAIQ